MLSWLIHSLKNNSIYLDVTTLTAKNISKIEVIQTYVEMWPKKHILCNVCCQYQNVWIKHMYCLEGTDF